MARVTVEDCLEKLDNRFKLILVASKRAREIAKGSEPLVEWENDKPTVVALREIAEELITVEYLEEKVRPDAEELFLQEAEELDAATAALRAEIGAELSQLEDDPEAEASIAPVTVTAVATDPAAEDNV